MKGVLRLNEPMAKHVSWRAGGHAARAYIPAGLEDLAAFLKTLPPAEPVLFVGLGSNLLVRDGGFKGTVILMHAVLNEVRIEDESPRQNACQIWFFASLPCKVKTSSGFCGANVT